MDKRTGGRGGINARTEGIDEQGGVNARTEGIGEQGGVNARTEGIDEQGGINVKTEGIDEQGGINAKTEGSDGWGGDNSGIELSYENEVEMNDSIISSIMMESMEGNPAGRNGAPDDWDPEYMLTYGDMVGDYRLIKAVSGFGENSTGQAEIYKAEKDGKEFAVKLYTRNVTIKEEISEYLIGKNIPYLSRMVAVGSVPIKKHGGKKKQYEISPWYHKVKFPMTYQELRRLIFQVNEGIHNLHEMAIIHKDIKPANIMLDSDNNYRIIDFGISSVLEEGQTHMLTNSGRTKEFAAPETDDKVFSTGHDYYSLGMSLYVLFTGKLPYEESEAERYHLLKTRGIKIPDSLEMPKELVKLIHGLTFYNSIPEINKKRWGYEEIKQWLTDPESMEDLDMEMYGEKMSGKVIKGNPKATLHLEKEIVIEGKEIWDSYTIADEMGNRWNMGQKKVLKGHIEDWFQENGSKYSDQREAAQDTQIILDDSSLSTVKKSEAYCKFLYKIEPKLEKFYWYIPKPDESHGYTCEEVGYYLFLEVLQEVKDGEKIPKSITELMESGILTWYLREQLKDKKRVLMANRILEDYMLKDKLKAAWKMGYLLAGKALFVYRGREFETREQLYRHVVEWSNGLSTAEAVEAMKNFPLTKEFYAWIEFQSDFK